MMRIILAGETSSRLGFYHSGGSVTSGCGCTGKHITGVKDNNDGGKWEASQCATIQAFECNETKFGCIWLLESGGSCSICCRL